MGFSGMDLGVRNELIGQSSCHGTGRRKWGDSCYDGRGVW